MNKYSDLVKVGQRTLKKELRHRGVDQSTIKYIISSGYSYTDAAQIGETKSSQYVSDGFYGSKYGFGLMPMAGFVSHEIRGIEPNSLTLSAVPTHRVRSIDEALQIIETGHAGHYFRNGRMCFRGQTKDYLVRREFPNPFVCDPRGYERLILPSFWRAYRDKWNDRPIHAPQSIFHTPVGQELIYQGIDLKALAVKNLAAYGLHTIADLEGSPDEETQKYLLRRRTHIEMPTLTNEFPMLEQHYGLSTAGLDMTFDLPTAAFFALNRFVSKRSGLYDYDPVDTKGDSGFVYCFVFCDPPVSETADLVADIGAFRHIPPLRPLRQRCALIPFNCVGINEAVCDLSCILIVDPELERSQLPQKEYLFPNRSEDPFYDALLQLKILYPQQLSEVVEYDL